MPASPIGALVPPLNNGENNAHPTPGRKPKNILKAYADSIEFTVSHEESMPPLPESAYIDPSVADGASPWLDEYVKFSRRWSPRSYEGFHEAIGLWLLSTIAARRVSLHFGHERYTNLMIALATRTSVFAKTTATKVAVKILSEAGLSHLLCPDDATPQAFIHGLAGHLPSDWASMSREKQLMIQERVAFAGQRGWFYDEFGQKVSAMMKEGGFMADFRGLLRKFDDTPDFYEYATMGRKDKVDAPYLALLASLTPADLRPFAKKGAALWGDGFWARFAFIAAPPNVEPSFERFPLGERITPPTLLTKLKEWHKRLGLPTVKIAPTPDADVVKGKGKDTPDLTIDKPAPLRCILGEGVFDAFYCYHDGLIGIGLKSQNHDLDGNNGRMAEKALRVAILLGSLENHERIEMRHWARAQQITESWRQNLHYLYDEVTRTDVSTKSLRTQTEEQIMSHIAIKGPLTQREIQGSIRSIKNCQEAEEIVQRMVKAGWLVEREAGKTIRYDLAG